MWKMNTDESASREQGVCVLGPTGDTHGSEAGTGPQKARVRSFREEICIIVFSDHATFKSAIYKK